MSPQDREAIDTFLERIRAGRPGPASPWGVPGAAPALPPVDPAAEAHILATLTRSPGTAYRLAQTAFAQEAALVEAQNRLQQLEWDLEAARREAKAGQSRGLFGFGGSRPAAMPPRPMPALSPMGMQMAGGQRGGSGFLATAAATAAGVAGGMVLGSLLADALGGGAAEAATAAGGFAQEAVTGAAEAAGLPTVSGMQDAVPADAEGGHEDAAGWDSGGFDEEAL